MKHSYPSFLNKLLQQEVCTIAYQRRNEEAIVEIFFQNGNYRSQLEKAYLTQPETKILRRFHLLDNQREEIGVYLKLLLIGDDLKRFSVAYVYQKDYLLDVSGKVSACAANILNAELKRFQEKSLFEKIFSFN